MTHPKNPNSHRIEIGNDWTITEDAPSGPLRRTIVQGAAWTVPVVAMAVATPAAAASLAPKVVLVDNQISGAPTWAGQDANGRPIVNANSGMTQSVFIRNEGTGPAPANTITLELDQLAYTVSNGGITPPPGWVSTGSRQYVASGQTHWVYQFTYTLELAAGQGTNQQFTWTVGDGNTIIQAYGPGNLTTSGQVILPGVGAAYADTKAPGSPQYIIRTR